MTSIIAWITPIPTSNFRSLILRKLTYSDGLSLIVNDDEDEERLWNIHFQSAIGYRCIDEEFSNFLLQPIMVAMREADEQGLPTTGGLFEVLDSDWIQALAPETSIHLSDVRHWVVSCYDEVVEVLARRYTITQEPRSSE